MLVLSRHPGDEIEIGEGIVVKIVDVRGNKVRVGIEAPRGVSVLRRELRERAPALQPVPCCEEQTDGT